MECDCDVGAGTVGWAVRWVSGRGVGGGGVGRSEGWVGLGEGWR